MLPAPAPVVVVQEEPGGAVAAFDARIRAYRAQGVTVRIEGYCNSACTMLASLPADRICVGPDASLGFHRAFYATSSDLTDMSVPSPRGTAVLMRHYPARLRAWIASKGGLTKNLIVLRGAELLSLFRECKP